MTYDGFCLALCLSMFSSGPCAEPAPLPAESFGAERPSSPEQATSPQATLPAQPARSSLRRHSAEANDMRKAVIAGQLADFQRAAAIIASDSWSSPLRDDPGADIDRVRAAARRAATTTELPAATAALGALGTACSRCHQDVGGPRSTEIISAPADLARPSDESMVVHVAAEQALWQGLVFPSDDGWQIGARMLASAPELDSDVAEVSALAHRTLELGRETAEAPRGARAESYGKILATCAACHSRIGVIPR